MWTTGALLLAAGLVTLDTEVVRALGDDGAGVVEMLGVVEVKTVEVDGYIAPSGEIEAGCKIVVAAEE